MELNHLRARASTLGLDPYLVLASKKVLIQAIQEAEGHQPCFLDDDRFACREQGCEWRRDCLKLTAAWRR